MPAIPSDIAAATRDVVQATWSDATVGARYPSARDGSAAPAEGFFDSIADAQTVVNARAVLIGVERRRFAVAASGIVWPDIAAGVPVRRLVDAEQGVDAPMIATRIEVDLEAEATNHELFG